MFEPDSSIKIVDISETKESSENPPAPNLSIGTENQACIILKRNSDGIKDFTKISHYSIVNCLSSLKNDPGINSQDIALYHGPSAPGFEIIQYWLPLSVGARIEITDESIISDPVAVSRRINENNVSIVFATPSEWKVLLESGWKGERNVKALCWGEVPSKYLVEQLTDNCRAVWNLYGTLETAMVASVGKVNSNSEISIGRPIANTSLRIVDQSNESSPVGVPGEIEVKGACLSNGNQRNASSMGGKPTAQPDNNHDHENYFRTGDIGRYNLHGEIEFLYNLGRRCSVRGYSFPPQDIEAILVAHSAVRDAVVYNGKDGTADSYLAAYLILDATEEETVSFGKSELIREIKRIVRSRLPEYMVPDRFVLIDHLPRMADGRVDYASLPAASNNEFDDIDYVAPCNDTESSLVKIWQALLKIEKISVTDSFFDLGGQSLLAARMFARIEEEFGRRFPIALLFQSPTIKQLARKLTENEKAENTWPSLVPIQTKGKNTALFLVHGAGGNVLLYRTLAERLEPDYPLYGLQSKGLDGDSNPLRTIEEMAECYLEEIRSIQPEGPYCLGGYCLGGTIAYEMAQRLTAQGERVGMVAMLDTYNFQRALKVGFFTFLLQKFKFHWLNFIQLRPWTMFKYLREKRRLAGDGGWAHIRTERPGTTLQDGAARAESGIEATVQEINDHAADIYDPKPYAGKLTLFKPQVNYKFYPDPKLGWGDLAIGGLDIVELPVNPHAMLVEPYVEVLSQELKLRIDRMG
jgi:thioesterase domain-containing protein/acyl carrier protein